MSLELWLMFCAAYLFTTLAPGPNVLLVIKNSLQYGWKSALVTILGNLSCQLIVVGLVAVGVGELISRLPAWFMAMKLLGGGYLIYLGVKSLLSSGAKRTPSHLSVSGAPVRSRHLFLQAFMVSASNPKTLIFLSAFLPQFLDVTHPHLEQFSVMYLSICAIVTSVHLGYALMVSRLGQSALFSGLEAKMAKITGGLLITMGGGVLLSSRS